MRWMLILTLVAVLAPVASVPAGAEVADKRWHGSTPHPWKRSDGRPSHTTTIVVVPTPIYIVPSRCWAPGYWTYAWVPQVSTYDTWVPGAWSPDGYWIEAHYEQRLASSGYWQPYWVEGRWDAC